MVLNSEGASVPLMWLHNNGQWSTKSKGRNLYFGSDLAIARKRVLVWKLFGIKAKRNLLSDFVLQYCDKIGFECFDDAYIASWAALDISSHQMVEDVGCWFKSQREFKSRCDGNRVYIIEDSDGDVKIGHAKDVRNRFSNLQTAHKKPLSLLCSLPGGRFHESQLHNLFERSRIAGEWFKKTADLQLLIDMAINIQCKC